MDTRTPPLQQQQQEIKNRFNRPLTPKQIQATIKGLRDAALSHAAADQLLADTLFKGLHIITMLWREVAFHDELADKAAGTLAQVEADLRHCLEQRELNEKVVEEVAKLKQMIVSPADTFKGWSQSDAVVEHELHLSLSQHPPA